MYIHISFIYICVKTYTSVRQHSNVLKVCILSNYNYKLAYRD